MSRPRISHARLRPALAGVLALALVAPAPALAHGIVGRADLPIPAWAFAWVAAGILIGSWVALGRLWATPRLDGRDEGRRAFTLPRGWDALWGAAGVAVFVLLIVAGLGGSQDARNGVPTLVFVLFWVGVPIASVLAGDVWAAVCPWRAAARAARALTRRAALPPPLPLARRLGRWPAVLGVLAFAWLELVYTGRDRPALLAVLALAYAGAQLTAMAAFGIDEWTRRGDAFGVLFNVFARLSPWERRGREVRLRRPLAGLAGLGRAPGTIALLCAAIGATAFDGATNGGVWRELSRPLVRWVHGLGAGGPAAEEVARTVGLLVCVGLIAGLYTLGVRGMRGDSSLGERFATSLAPIAFGYLLAHYFSLLIYQGQTASHVFADPLGHGAPRAIDYGVISAAGIWYVQVAALVGGHVGGVVVAHDRAVGAFADAEEAVASQRWMLMVMVTLTCVGLYLLSAVGT